MDEKTMIEFKAEGVLSDEELAGVAGGVTAGNAETGGTRISFTFDYSCHDSRYQIRDMIRSELRSRGVPEHVIQTVPVMNPEKAYMSYGNGGMRVEWEPGWETPRFFKTHD